MRTRVAPNRTLELEELDERPSYRRVLHRLDALLAREPRAYLHASKRWEYPWAVERAGLAEGGRVADVGCGASIFPVYLAHAGHRVVGVDRTLPHRLGAGAGVRVDYVRADMTALPLADAAFDALFCISVIEHLPERRIPDALAELRRVLKPGAALLLTTDYYEDADAEIWYEGPDRRFPVDWRVFDRERLQRLVLDAPGFRIEGALDLDVDWPATRPRMRRFHGYPYTSVGVKLVKE